MSGTIIVEQRSLLASNNECATEKCQECLNTTQAAHCLQEELEASLRSTADLETKLCSARRLLEIEKKARREVEYERNLLEKKIAAVVGFVQHEINLKDGMREKLALLGALSMKRTSKIRRIEERYENDINSTRSFLSELLTTESEEDLLEICLSLPKRYNQKHSYISETSIEIKKPHTTLPTWLSQFTTKNRCRKKFYREANNVREKRTKESKKTKKLRTKNISTTPTTSASSLVKPRQDPIKITSEAHDFVSKTFIFGSTCTQCQTKIRFGSAGIRCRNCPIRCHSDCQYLLTIYCCPKTKKSQYSQPNTSGIPPMIPPLIVHCVNEIETRGLNVAGIYSEAVLEREIKYIKDRFLRGKRTPHLANINIHVLCGCIKDFLRSQREALITTKLWKNFCNAVQNTSKEHIRRELFKAIKAMPKSNRDTLAFLILHFQRIIECCCVQMSIDDIAHIFGPLIVGYSSTLPDQHAITAELFTQCTVLQNLLQIPTQYWTQYLSFKS